MKRWMHRLGLLLIPCLFTFLLLEITLRVLDPLDIDYYNMGRVLEAHQQADEDFAYRYQPETTFHLRGVEYRINREGYRGPELEIPKPQGRKRILILGDSVVMGWGCREDLTFVSLLRQRLSREHPDWDLVSAGCGSWNTRTQWEFLRKQGIRWQPDLILLVIVDNDSYPKPTGRTFIPREILTPPAPPASSPQSWRQSIRSLLLNSQVLRYVQVFRRRRLAASESDYCFSPESPAWQDTENAITEIVAFCRERNIQLLPLLYGWEQGEFMQAFFARWTEILTKLKTPPLRLKQDPTAPGLVISFSDKHANPAGHQQIAAELWEMLKPHLETETAEPGH